MAELSQGVDVAKKGRPSAERYACFQVLVLLAASAAVELYYGQRI